MSTRRPIRFSIRTLLVLVGIAGIIAGIYAAILRMMNGEAHVATLLQSNGFNCEFENGFLSEVYGKADSSLTADEIQALSRLHRLRLLALYDCEIPTAGFAELQAPHLEVLTVTSTNVDDALLSQLVRFESLEYLDPGKTKVTGSGFNALRALPKLRGLCCQGAPVTDESLKNLAGWRALDRLVLNNTNVTGPGLANLTPLPLKELQLDQLSIRDTDLAPLYSLPLKTLTLLGTQVTEKGLAELCEKIQSLESIDVSSTAVTTDGAKTIQLKFPKVHIYQ